MQQSDRMPSSSDVSHSRSGGPHAPPGHEAAQASPVVVLPGLSLANATGPGAVPADAAAGWRQALGQIRLDDTIGLAVRLPVCPQTCWHCSNTPRLQGTHGEQSALLQAVAHEAALAAAAGAAQGEVVHLHFTGGSANIVGAASLQPLVQALRTQLRITRSAGWSLVADPRACTPDELAALRAMGFDELTLGVVDLDGMVQAGIGRLVSLPLLDDVVRQAWRLRWRQVQIDLVCGLPGQHPLGWVRTLQAVLALGPTRIRCRTARRDAAAHPAQRVLARDAWPEAETLPVLCATTERLLGEAGYQSVAGGLWVLEDDPCLRESVGTAAAACAPRHRLALGPGGCSRVAGRDVLNEADPAAYVAHLACGRSAARAWRPAQGPAEAFRPSEADAPGPALH
jgi:coproporphyrinogen III oxidase-like Fe-S oxidoreductase